MSELTPITRVESYLDAIVNSGIPPTEDITRIETFLQAIYDNQVCALTPITRIEMFLGKISGQDIVLPEPITRVELYLAAIAGEDVELPENPITRLEMYLAEWADSGDWTTISGAIVEFITQRAHKLKSCVVSLEPQQDLHGYDSPWPEGGGKNKFNPAEAQNNKWLNGTTGAIENANGYWVTGFIPVKTGDVVRCTAKGSARCAWYNSDKSEATYFGWSGGEGYPTTAIYDGFVILTVLASTVAFGGDFIVTINDQDITFAPYENICPISGWTEANVTRTGKNLFDSDKLLSVTGWTKSDNVYTGRCDYLEHYVFFQNNGDDSQFTVSIDHLGQYSYRSGYIAIYYTDGTSSSVSLDGDTWKHFTLTSTTGKTVNRIEYLKSNNQTISIKNFQIELGSVETAYEEFRGNSYSVTWEDEAGTVYGGTLTVNEDGSGSVTATQAEVDMGDVLWGADPNRPGVFYGSIPNTYPARKNMSDVIMCSCYKVENISVATNKDMYISGAASYGGTAAFVRDTRFASSTAAEYKTAIAGEKYIYEIATPIAYQLTQSQVITALKGYNAMWSDGGDIEVTVHGTPVEASTQQALNMLLGGAYHNNQTADDVSDEEALDIILGGENR